MFHHQSLTNYPHSPHLLLNRFEFFENHTLTGRKLNSASPYVIIRQQATDSNVFKFFAHLKWAFKKRGYLLFFLVKRQPKTISHKFTQTALNHVT